MAEEGHVPHPPRPRLLTLGLLGLLPASARPWEGLGITRLPEETTGWAATLGGSEPPGLTTGNAVEVLIDEPLYAAIESCVDAAKETLDLAQLLFFPDFRTTFTSRGTLLDAFLDAAKRGVRSRILLNENALVLDTCSDVEEVTACVKDDIEVRRFPLGTNVMHAKLLVRDEEEAFLIGPPFQQKFWDTERHLVDEERRGNKRPCHDLALRLRGPVVADLQAEYERLWCLRGAPCGRTPKPRPAPLGPQSLQVLRTYPPHLLGDRPYGERGILEGYLRALNAAQDYVYMESQYFTSRSVVAAIGRALEEKPDLQVIVVINETNDIPTYVAWQKRRLRELGHPNQERLGVFTLWSGPPYRSVYVHSKTAFADDAWATLGTANLDSMSLETGDEFGLPTDSNIDLNVALFDGIEGQPATGVVPELRRRLWGEHLGDEGVWTTRRPDGGWLPLWRRVAQENQRRMDAKEPLKGHVIPYRPGALED